MKKAALLGCAVAVCLMCGLAQAEKLSVSAWGDFTTLNLTDVNKVEQSTDPMTTNVALDSIQSGFVGGVDVMYAVSDTLDLGVRGGYLMGLPVTYSANLLFFTMDITQSASMIPLMAGGKYRVISKEELSLSGYGFVGYGLATYSMKTEVTGFEAVSVDMDGGALVADAGLAGEFAVTPQISVGLNVGYRYAMVSEVRFSKDSQDGSMKKGDVVKHDDGSPVKFDFSGLTAGVNASFKF